MQSIHKRALAFVGVLLVVIFGFEINSLPVHAATTAAPDISGQWQGQGTYNSGQSAFDMTLTINAVNGNTFSGTLEEDTYNSTVAISGSITSSTDTSTTITFTDPSTISGGQIALNCTYTATISKEQMTGDWYYPGDTSPDGTISLTNISSDINHFQDLLKGCVLTFVPEVGNQVAILDLIAQGKFLEALRSQIPILSGLDTIQACKTLLCEYGVIGQYGLILTNFNCPEQDKLVNSSS